MIQPDGTIAFATAHFTAGPDKAVREFLSFRVHAMPAACVAMRR
ncbi:MULTISPECIES: hypothetical protein [unclassified Bradyrhizobium]